MQERKMMALNADISTKLQSGSLPWSGGSLLTITKMHKTCKTTKTV